MKLVIWTSAFIIALTFSAVTGATRQSQREMNLDACESHRKVDAELNRIYNQILRDRSADKNFVEKMKAAERAWVTFRDAHVSSIYPDPSPQAYGSVNPMCRCVILEQLTRDRIKMLSGWVDGIEEGNVCGGSQKIKR